jgi:nucleotide-binding universal stress UspA family protein
MPPSMRSTIVVPLDGSPLAATALPYAARLARPADGRLVLVRAAGPGPPREAPGGRPRTRPNATCAP